MIAKKSRALIVASKLIIGMGSAARADDASLGSKSPSETAPKLGLFEIGYPLELLTPPQEGLVSASATSGSKNTTADANAQKLAQKGRIWTKVIPLQDAKGAFPAGSKAPVIDFVVSNVRNDGPVTVYLLYGTKLSDTSTAGRANAGVFNLDLKAVGKDTFVLAAVKLQPEEKRGDLPVSPIGHDIGAKTRSAVISIALNDLSKVTGNEVYFQAAVVPDKGGIAEAQASEVDYFVIERVTSQANSGSKASVTADSTIKNTDGSTTAQSCGKQGVVAVCTNSTTSSSSSSSTTGKTSTPSSTSTAGSKTTTTQSGTDSGSKTTTTNSTSSNSSTTGGTTTGGTTGSKK